MTQSDISPPYFQLKPYVAYNAPSISQSEFTAKDLFKACYAQQIVEDFAKEQSDKGDEGKGKT